MGYARTDSQAEHQAGVARLRAGGRGAVGGMIGNPLPIAERPDAMDVARLVDLKRGKCVLLPNHEATEDTRDLSRTIRQLTTELGDDAIRWLHSNAREVREQYQPLLSGQSATIEDGVDEDLAAAFVNLINET